MQKIKLMFEFEHGPIWDSEPFTGKLMSGIEAVDSDPDLELWNRNLILKIKDGRTLANI